MSDWFDEYVAAPVNELLANLPVGGEVRDLEQCDALAHGVEGLLRRELRAQYAAWPPDSTTDGTSIYVCVRTDVDVLKAFGLTDINFDGHVFPCRVEVRRSPLGVTVTGYIGLVDATGAPPRLPSGTVMVPARHGDHERPHPELIVGRRQIPIEWTLAFDVR